MKFALLAIAAISLLCNAAARAALAPVFEFQFPASVGSADLTTNPTIADQSTAHTKATAAWFAKTAATSAAPTGQSGNALSWTAAANAKAPPVIVTALPTSMLLSADMIAAVGGFTMDVWFNSSDLTAGTQKIIDRGGADGLLLSKNELMFYFSGETAKLQTPVLKNTWYHAVAAFNTNGSKATSDTKYGDDRVSGTATLTVNNLLVGTMSGATVSGLGDASAINYLSVGRDPADANGYFSGMIYSPTLYLGVASIPEPVDVSAIGLAMMACFRRVRQRPH